jgi:hypothetical protein
LLQVHPADAGFFGQFARGTGVEVFVDIEKTAGQCPAAFEGGVRPFHQQQMQSTSADREHHHVSGHRRMRVGVVEGLFGNPHFY